MVQFPMVPVPDAVPAKTVLTVPVSGSDSVPAPSWNVRLQGRITMYPDASIPALWTRP